MLVKIFSLTLLTALSTSAFALDKADQDGLADTQNLLHDQKKLDAFAKENPDAQKAMDQMSLSVGGDAKKQAAANDLSSAIFADMVKANNGNTADIQAQLQNALKDPAAFLTKLPPEQQKRIRELASDLDKKNASAPSDKK